MPPKKKSAGKKPAKEQPTTLIDGLTKDEMSVEQMKEHIVRLQEEVDRVREEKHYFRLERDKVQTFKDATERKLEETEARLKKINKDVEDNEDLHKINIEVYKQKMKHLLCEHQNTICEFEADTAASAEVMKKELDKVKAELHQKVKNLTVDLEALDVHVLQKQKQLNEKDFAVRTEPLKMIVPNETWLEEIKTLEINRMKSVATDKEHCWRSHYADLTDSMKKALADTEESTTFFEKYPDKVKALWKKMEEGIVEIKQTQAALALLSQDEIHLAKAVEQGQAIKTKMEYILAQRKTLSAPSLADASMKKKITAQKAKKCTLERDLGKLQLERDELRDSNAKSLAQMQQEADVRSAEREEKVKAPRERLEQTDAQLHSLLSSSNIDQTALAGLLKECKEKLDSHNRIIEDLKEKKIL